MLSNGFNCVCRYTEASEHTCFDGIQNGDEAGVDCGGACDPCGGSCSGTLLVNASAPGAATSGVFTKAARYGLVATELLASR